MRSDFAAWLAADADHRRDWEEIIRADRALGALGPQLQERWPPIGLRPRPGRRRLLRWSGAAAAALLAAAWLPDAWRDRNADHVTGAAELRSITLADGSRARLGPDTAIAVEFSRAARQVRLIRGRAFLEVAPDAAHPFRVVAGPATAAVLGTAFEVRRAPEAATVSVAHGTVRVAATSGDAVRMARSGDWVRVTAAGGITAGRIAPEEIALWRDGLLVARDHPVAAVVDELRPYFSGRIIVRGAALAGRPLTGVYRLADPEGTLRAIAQTQGATLHRLTPWLLVLSGD